MNVIIMGPPGCGKGTQANGIVQNLGVVHISTGDMLRAAVKSGSELGKRVEAVMAAGDLVSDDLMMDIIKERLGQADAQDGWLLDGFPRTVEQAEGLVALLERIDRPVGAVVSLEVPDEEIVQRPAHLPRVRFRHQPAEPRRGCAEPVSPVRRRRALPARGRPRGDGPQPSRGVPDEDLSGRRGAR
jgi:adenylate kinase family enzyme